MNPCPPPGIYENIAFEEYLAWDAISNSRINLARRSLAHFHANIALEPKPCLQLGSLTHCGKFEPLEIARRYAVMPQYEDDLDNLTKNGERSFAKTTNYYKQKARDFAASNRGKEVVSESMFNEMIGIVTSLSQHDRARMYLEGPGRMELAIVWIDDETGLSCKARLDKFSPSVDRFADLKTYTPQQSYLSPSVKFSRAIANFGYHRQMTHYRNGVRALTGKYCAPALVVVENAAPYCIMAAPVGEEWMEIGRREVSETMQAIATAYERDEWPGYESPDAWTPPAYYGDEEEVELTSGGQPFVV